MDFDLITLKRKGLCLPDQQLFLRVFSDCVKARLFCPNENPNRTSFSMYISLSTEYLSVLSRIRTHMTTTGPCRIDDFQCRSLLLIYSSFDIKIFVIIFFLDCLDEYLTKIIQDYLEHLQDRAFATNMA